MKNDIESCVKLISNHTNPNGYFIGIDWFSTNHSDYKKAKKIENGSVIGINSKQFKDTGIVHFFHSNEIIARVTAQASRQPGLAAVVLDLLDFDGDEIYFQEVPQLVGRTFADAVLARSYAP